jgi:hypothetical protein
MAPYREDLGCVSAVVGDADSAVYDSDLKSYVHVGCIGGWVELEFDRTVEITLKYDSTGGRCVARMYGLQIAPMAMMMYHEGQPAY